MPEPIVIKFVADSIQLEDAVDTLVKMGMVEKGVADEFRKAAVLLKAHNEDLKKTGQAAEVVEIEMSQLSKAIKDIPKKIIDDAAKNTLNETGKVISDVTTKSLKLTTQLREMKNELSKLETAGKLNSQQYTNLAIKAAHLEDQIGDTAQSIRILASDTRFLDTTLGVAQGIAGGFAVAQGAAALFGGENENLQKTLVKVGAALALLQGLQQLQLTLDKNSIVTVNLKSIAQGIYNKFIIEATLAQRAFNIAAAASIIGLVIVGIYAAVKAYQAYTERVREANRERIALNTIEQEAVSNYSEEVLQLQNLVDQIKNENTSNQDRERILKTVNEKYGDQIGHFKNIEDLEKRFIERAEAYIQVLKLRSQAQAAMNLATKEFETALKNQNEGIEENTSFWDKVKLSLNAVTGNLTGTTKNLTAIQEKANEVIADATKNQEFYLNKFNEFTKEAADLVDKFGFEVTKTATITRDIWKDTPLFIPLPSPDQIEDEFTEPSLAIIRDYNKKVFELNQDRKDEDDQTIEDWIEKRRDAYATAVGIAQQGLDAIFGISQVGLTNDQIALDKQLKNKQISQEKYDKEVSKIKTRQAIKDKREAEFNAILDIPASFLKGLTQGGLALAIAYAALATIQAGIIASTDIPQFAKGTRKVKGGREGKDSVHALLMPGEGVMPTDVNREYDPILTKIYNRSIPSVLLNRLAKMNMPDFEGMQYMAEAGNNISVTAIDYDKMGNIFEKALKKNPQLIANIDLNGAQLLQKRGNETRELMDKRYSSQ